ncbi:DUF1345 domain-containing protein [Leucobacter viscericola]|uniref:DUF1345 domain-containing protein n=1 Tax=Leucobacter viscericola TaxID=2714935 RepID=A0A6G7XDV2_9MICO|nr:DUF1345 domain-containing protein [Leucobacter viscericola]QIK62790.1 DUF1345 domain-containing protein [Leucobacter viscericola]
MSTSPRSQVKLRWAVAVVVGIVVGVLVTFILGIVAGLLAGWAALATVSTIWTFREIWKMSPASARDHATTEDPGQTVARLIALIGSIVSLAAVVAVVIHSRESTGIDAYLLAGTAVVSVFASWSLIQLDYTLRYAREYYQDDAGGIDFNQQSDPDYADFVYFSTGLGMGYQVADTNVTSNKIRRIVVGQMALAYLFGTGIIATAITLITGLG